MTRDREHSILCLPEKAVRLFTSCKGGAAMVTYADMFTYTLVLITLASLIITITKCKK